MKHNDKTLSLRNRSGFSLVELLVYMAILFVLMALVMTSFIQTQQRTAQQSRIAETQIETGVGLGLLRADLENAGFGLPWAFSPDPALAPRPYIEPGPLASAPNVPSALDSQNGTGLSGSDHLVIRAANVVSGAGGQGWGTLGNDNVPNLVVQPAGKGTQALLGTDRVIALRTINSNSDDQTVEFRSLAINDLAPDGANNYTFQPNPLVTTDNGSAYPLQSKPAAWASIQPDPVSVDSGGFGGEKLLLYGIAGAGAINRPFNRADYFIVNTNVPSHCAPGTGVLVKAPLGQADVAFLPASYQPVADCVADFQVVYHLDKNGDGKITPEDAGKLPAAGADQAAQIRAQVREVRCYILLHEGGEDKSYTHPSPNIDVGEVDANGAFLAGRQQFALNNLNPTDADATWAHYRWKVVSVAVTPKNLRQ